MSYCHCNELGFEEFTRQNGEIGFRCIGCKEPLSTVTEEKNRNPLP